jgi:cysteine synthase A
MLSNTEGTVSSTLTGHRPSNISEKMLSNTEGRSVSSTLTGHRPSTGILSTFRNTPLVLIPSLSNATGCRILAKCEFLVPGGSIKDRAALEIVDEFEKSGLLVPRVDEPYTIIEATGGNTGIALALIAAARGYKCVLTMPSSVSTEKIEFARTLGAEVIVCPPCPFSDPRHYYQRAKQLSEEIPKSVWTNQFENLSNGLAHYRTTGPEIWQQSGERLDGRVVSAGTGGTINGLSNYLKEKNPLLKAYVIDPSGSGLKSFVETGEIKASTGNSIAEGVGILRLTKNFAAAKVDGAYTGVDKEAVAMAYYLLKREGIFVGPSAAMNVVGAVKLARQLGPGHSVATVLCDGGGRYASKMWNKDFLEKEGLTEAAKVDASRDICDFVG